jgi:hypothetical protein
MFSAFIYSTDVRFVDSGLVTCVPVITNMYVYIYTHIYSDV